MYAGKIVETGATTDIITQPEHPYTKGLLKALPGALQPGSQLNQIPGMMPTLTELPRGCNFHPRCNLKKSICENKEPVLEPKSNKDKHVACHMV